MSHMPPFPTDLDSRAVDLAFVPPGTPTFADVLARLEADETLSPVRRRDLASGLRRVAGALGRPVEDVPAQPGWLQPRLHRIQPAALGLSAKTWSNVVSDARAALAQFGIVGDRVGRKGQLGSAWRPLWEAALESGDLTTKKALARFVYFLDRLGVAPDAVGEAHLETFRAALAENEVRRSPEAAAKNAHYAWNVAVERIPGWPSRKLHRATRRQKVVLPIETYPESFSADLARYLDLLRSPDLLADDGDLRPLKPSSIAQYRRELLRFAGVLVRSGVPAEEITGLGALVRADRVERGLRDLLAVKGNKVTAGITATARALQSLARRLPGVPEEDRRAVDRLAGRVTPRKAKAMTAKTRTRLRPLQNPEVRQRLVLLPDRLFERVGDDRSRAASLLREQALAIAILTWCPVRRGNLASIDVERHLQRPGDGRAYLVFEAHEVKNGQRLEFELPAHIVAMLDRHLATRSPHLCPAATPWLFPRRTGLQPMSPDDLAKSVTGRLRRELGLEINLHLFRSFAVMIYLDANPGAYEGARRLLGHSRTSTTIAVYSGLEARTVGRQFGDLIERERRR